MNMSRFTRRYDEKLHHNHKFLNDEKLYSNRFLRSTVDSHLYAVEVTFSQLRSYKNSSFYSPNSECDYVCFIESWIEETKAKENHFDFLEKYVNNSCISNKKIVNVLRLVEPNAIDNKSFINFIRHLPSLEAYLEDESYNVSVIKNIIRLHLWHAETHLVLYFRNDFLMDFYSYDQASEDDADQLVYSMKGCFSSSSALKKSYKIERLLSVLDKHVFFARRYLRYNQEEYKQVNSSKSLE